MYVFFFSIAMIDWIWSGTDDASLKQPHLQSNTNPADLGDQEETSSGTAVPTNDDGSEDQQPKPNDLGNCQAEDTRLS